jgi:hypothetical protein
LEDVMGKKIRFWTGIAVGAAFQYLYDPKAGPARRAHLRQRLSARLRDGRDRFMGKPVGMGNIDHMRMWRTEARRTAGRNF